MTIDHQAFFIDGEWRAAQTEDRFAIISPRSEQVIGHVPAASTADIDAAVAAARRAFDEGEWPRLTPAERADYLTRMADAIARRQEELAALITEELGLHAVPLAGLPGRLAGDEPQLQRRDRPQPRHRAGAAQRPRSAGRELGGRQHHPDGRRQPRRPGAGRRRRRLPGLQLRLPRRAAEGRTRADRGLHRGRQGDRAQPAGHVHLRRHLRGGRAAAGRHQHRRRPRPRVGLPRAPPRRRHGQLHRLGRDRRPDRRRLRRAHPALRARARRQVRGDRPGRREARGRAPGAHRRQRRHATPARAASR